MPLEKVDQVDLIAEMPDGTWRLPLVVEEGEWGLPNAAWLLHEKVNAYLIYALDGQMVEEYPDAAGKPMHLVISTVDPMPLVIEQLVAQMRPIVKSHGLSLAVERLPLNKAA